MHAHPPPRPTFAAIDLASLAFNFRSIRAFVGPGIGFMAVIKADAYGHGAVECGKELARLGADWLSVATLEEAVELRDAGIESPILCLGGFYLGQEHYGMGRNVTPAVFTLESAERIHRAAAELGLRAKVHLKIDTGMGRVGIPHRDLPEIADRLAALSNLDIEGAMTHFAAADAPSENDFTETQSRRFYEALDLLRAKGIEPKLTDLANSPGAVAHPASRAGMVRIGGILYGLGRDVLPTAVDSPAIRPVMSLFTRLAQIKAVPAGTSIGYGRTFVTTRPSLIGTVPIGYHDGFPRALSNRGTAIVAGRPVPVAGRVSMDWVTLDLTEVPAAAIGDKVTLIGRDGDACILAEDVAEAAGTISYEITCGIAARVPRRFLRGDSGD